MQDIDIITRNFFKLMRSGAFLEVVTLEHMSAYKWSRLMDIVVQQDVVSVVAKAIKNMQFDLALNMPNAMRDKVREMAKTRTTKVVNIEMKNSILKKKLAQIHAAEKKASDYSEATLKLFDYIIANCQVVLSKGTSTLLVIKLGTCIRTSKDNVDYAKIERWLGEMHMTRVAGLVGSVLIDNFAFKPEEVPFVRKVDPKAARVMMQAVMKRRKQKHNAGITYFEYAPLENTSILLGRLKARLEAIDE